MKKIDDGTVEDFNTMVKELSNRLTERISELHEVKGGQAERHAFSYYRSLLYDIQRCINDGLIDEKNKKT